MEAKADLHNHLRTSSIFRDRDFNHAIDLAYRRLGENGIFGMVNFSDMRYEHFSGLKGYERFEVGENGNGLYIPSRKILVVKGQEVPTKQGHLLVIGLGKNKHIKELRDVKDTIREAKDNDGIIILDHPFYKHGLGPYLMKSTNISLLNDIDAVEIHNGEAAFGTPFIETGYAKVANALAEATYKFYKERFPNLGALSTSDGHSMYELGSSWTEIDSPFITNTKGFNRSLREAVRKANLDSPMKKKKSIVGAIDHILDLKFIINIAPKLGLEHLFETDRPGN